MSSFLSQEEIEQLMNKLNNDVVNAAKDGQTASEEKEVTIAEAPKKSGEKELPMQEVEFVRFPELEEVRPRSEKRDLRVFRSVPVKLSMDLGEAVLNIRDVLSLQKGSIIKLDKLAGENVVIRLNGKPFAMGEVVVINDNFGFRVAGIGTSTEKEQA